MYMFIRRTRYGYSITTFNDTERNEVHYIGCSRKNAIREHRQQYGLRYKHLTVIDM